MAGGVCVAGVMCGRGWGHAWQGDMHDRGGGMHGRGGGRVWHTVNERAVLLILCRPLTSMIKLKFPIVLLMTDYRSKCSLQAPPPPPHRVMLGPINVCIFERINSNGKAKCPTFPAHIGLLT